MDRKVVVNAKTLYRGSILMPEQHVMVKII